MSYIKKYITFISIILLAVVSSCKKENFTESEKGYIEFAVDISDRLNVEISKGSDVTKSDVTVPESIIELYSGDELVYSFNYPEDTSESVAVDKGTYSVKAYSIEGIENEANFDIKKYAWSGEITVNANETNSFNFTMELSVAKITIGFTDEFIDQLGADNISVTVSNSSTGVLVYTPYTVDNEGYFDPIDGQFTYTISILRSNGTTYTATYSQVLSAADYLSLTFDVSDHEDTGDTDDDVLFNVTINQSLNEVNTNIIIDLESGNNAPTYSSTFELFDTTEIVVGESSSESYVCDFTSEYGLGHLYFNGLSDLFAEYGLSRTADLLNLTTSESSSFEAAGISISISTVTKSESDEIVSVDFTDFFNKLTPGDDGEFSYPFILTAIDKQLNITETTFTIKVVESEDTGEGEGGSTGEGEGEGEGEGSGGGEGTGEGEGEGEGEDQTPQVDPTVFIDEVYSTPTSYETATTANLVITATWTDAELPSTTAVLYRVKGAETWNVATSSEFTIDSSNKLITFTKVVDQNATYECSLGDVDASGNLTYEQDNIVEQLIENNYSVPNLGFDSWNSSTTFLGYVTYYPNSDASNSYWATGNEGVTSIFKNSNCQPETSKVVSGKAARMFTYTGITYVGVAAGNLYIGSYSTNISDPASSVTFGRDFSGGRPKTMTGYFMYSSGGNVTDDNGDEQTDKCHIYIKLLSNGTTVGYGEMLTDRTVTSYEQFEIDIDYTSDATVDEIAIVATSSHLGSDFIGASDSELYVDEFELRY